MVAKSKRRSREILVSAVDESLRENDDVSETDYDSGDNRQRGINGWFGRWRQREHELFESISEKLEEGELAYGQWRGEDQEFGYYYVTAEEVKEMNPGHPMQSEISAARKAQTD